MRKNPPTTAATPEEEICSIVDASLRLGLELFTVYALVQRQKLRAKLLPSGEFAIPISELQRVFRPHPALPTNERKRRAAC